MLRIFTSLITRLLLMNLILLIDRDSFLFTVKISNKRREIKLKMSI